MTVLCVVQARMGSTRLPGKVLADVGGQPLLGFMLDRLAPLEADAFVIATSAFGRDDPICDLASSRGIDVIRGPEDDVLQRFSMALDAHPADVVIRLTGDCPLIDPAIVQRALEVHARHSADYTSNTLQRTYPDGLDVEIISATALREAVKEAVDRDEREHVTPFFYRRPERYNLAGVCSGSSLGSLRWTIDTVEDLDWLRSTVARLPTPTKASWHEVLEAVGRSAFTDPTLEPLCIEGPLVLRRWRGAVNGEQVEVDVRPTDPGRGRVYYRGPPAARAPTIALLRDALRADKQIEHLEEAP